MYVLLYAHMGVLTEKQKTMRKTIKRSVCGINYVGHIKIEIWRKAFYISLSAEELQKQAWM
jgi:hypothetical protein